MLLRGSESLLVKAKRAKGTFSWKGPSHRPPNLGRKAWLEWNCVLRYNTPLEQESKSLFIAQNLGLIGGLN